MRVQLRGHPGQGHGALRELLARLPVWWTMSREKRLFVRVTTDEVVKVKQLAGPLSVSDHLRNLLGLPLRTRKSASGAAVPADLAGPPEGAPLSARTRDTSE